jgi:hypothetical protein
MPTPENRADHFMILTWQRYLQTHVIPSKDGISLQTRFVMKKIPASETVSQL